MVSTLQLQPASSGCNLILSELSVQCNVSILEDEESILVATTDSPGAIEQLWADWKTLTLAASHSNCNRVRIQLAGESDQIPEYDWPVSEMIRSQEYQEWVLSINN